MATDIDYECSECGHRFRIPEGHARDIRLLMCPACGSIDLSLVTAERPSGVWTARQQAPAPIWSVQSQSDHWS